jgi:hypothetical protein
MHTVRCTLLILMISLLFFSNAHAQLLIDEARDAKAKMDRVMNQLAIPTTIVDVHFPKSIVKENLDQIIRDLPKIEQEVGSLLSTQTNPVVIEVSIKTNSGSKLFKSCQNRIKTNVKKDGQDIPHALTIFPSDRGQVLDQQNGEWLVVVSGSGPVTLSVEILNQPVHLISEQYDVVTLPLPAAVLGNISTPNSGAPTVNSLEFKAQRGLTLRHSSETQASCATFIPYEIEAFTFTYTSRSQRPQNKLNGSANFAGSTVAIVSSVVPGDRFDFFNIILRHPDLANTDFAPNFLVFLR